MMQFEGEVQSGTVYRTVRYYTARYTLPFRDVTRRIYAENAALDLYYATS